MSNDSVDYVVARRVYNDRRPVVGVITRDDLIDLQGAGEDVHELAKFEADANDQMPWLNLANLTVFGEVEAEGVYMWDGETRDPSDLAREAQEGMEAAEAAGL